MAKTMEATVCVQVQYTISGNRLSTTFVYGKDVGSISGDEPRQVAEDFQATNLTPLKTALSQDVHFQQIYAWCPKPEFANPWTIPLEDIVGQIAQDSLPSNLPAIMRLYQVETGGRHNGRLCISGVAETDVTDSYITDGAYSDHWEPLVNALLTPLLAGEFGLCVIQRFLNGVAITPEAHVVNQIILNRAMGSMRRRTTELREIHP